MKRTHPLGLLRPDTRTFIILWRKKKNYPPSPFIDITDCIEILLGTPASHTESILSGVYNRTIELKEVQIGWDGTQLIDILLYYIEDYVKHRLRLAKTQALM